MYSTTFSSLLHFPLQVYVGVYLCMYVYTHLQLTLVFCASHKATCLIRFQQAIFFFSKTCRNICFVLLPYLQALDRENVSLWPDKRTCSTVQAFTDYNKLNESSIVIMSASKYMSLESDSRKKTIYMKVKISWECEKKWISLLSQEKVSKHLLKNSMLYPYLHFFFLHVVVTSQAGYQLYY